MSILNTLPDELRSHLGVGTPCLRSRGRLGDLHYTVMLANGTAGFLKFGQGSSAEDVREESERLAWLDGRASAPRPLFTWSDCDLAILLTAEVSGHPSHNCVSAQSASDVIRLLAHALRAIHSVPTSECPFVAAIDHEIERAERRLADGLVDTRRFAQETGQTVGVILAELKATTSIISDLVFTHGDYSLPNVILNDGTVTSVVDWSQAGVSSRNRDFMSVEKSIARNCDSQTVPRLIDDFYNHYGIGQPDREQVRYFWNLDQFWA